MSFSSPRGYPYRQALACRLFLWLRATGPADTPATDSPMTLSIAIRCLAVRMLRLGLLSGNYEIDGGG